MKTRKMSDAPLARPLGIATSAWKGPTGFAGTE
jgi:hypothetical protein